MRSTERPEYGDRPLSDAERIDRYEQRVAEYFSRPESRDKLDPFERMSREEIRELYRPDPDDPLRPRAVFEDGVVRLVDPARDGPSSDAERPAEKPQWHEEPETVRRIRADRDDRDAGKPEPTGEELLDIVPDKLSRRERVPREVVRAGGDLIDTGRDYGDHLADLLDSPKPTGAETRTPPAIPSVTEKHPDGVGVGEAATAIMVSAITAYYAFRAGWRYIHTPKERSDDAGH